MLYILGFSSITHKQPNLKNFYTVTLSSKNDNSYVTLKRIVTHNLVHIKREHRITAWCKKIQMQHLCSLNENVCMWGTH